MRQRAFTLIRAISGTLLLVGCGNDATEPNDFQQPAGAGGKIERPASGGSGGTAPTKGTAGTSFAAGGSAGHAEGGTSGSGGNEPTAGASAGGAPEGGMGGQSPVGGGGTGGGPSRPVDVFGIRMLKASKVLGDEWNSKHWEEGEVRSFDGRDPSDPKGWSIRRGNTALMEIDGKGIMSMGGSQPRFYVQPPSGQKKPFFRDIEFTGYFRRTANDGAANSGFSVGVRAHLNGHGSDNCNASTYYLIFRNSGTWIFDKEMFHPNDSPGARGNLFSGGGQIPVGKWIGMKFLAYNLPGDKAVKLEAYIDSESDGDLKNGGSWRKLGESIDDGDWDAPNGDCGYPANTVITQGGGVVFIRNTDVSKVQYTNVSWREIVDKPAEPN